MNENDSLKTLLDDAARRGIAYRQSCGDRAVAPSGAAVAAVERLVEPLGEEGLPDAEVLALLDEIGSPATMAMAGPRFFGFVIGGSLPVGMCCDHDTQCRIHSDHYRNISGLQRNCTSDCNLRTHI